MREIRDNENDYSTWQDGTPKTGGDYVFSPYRGTPEEYRAMVEDVIQQICKEVRKNDSQRTNRRTTEVS